MKSIHAHRNNYAFLTSASIPRVVGTLSVPTIVTMLTSSLYSVADTYFVSGIDTQATAAVGVGFAVLAIMQATGFFFGHGSGNYISRSLGAHHRREAASMASTGFVLAVLAGLLLTLVGEMLLTPMCVWLGSTPTVLPYTEQYLGILLLCAPLHVGSMTLNNQLRFQGNATLAMTGIVVGTLVNLILDPVLIFACHMGIQGAALATVLGYACSFATLLLMTRQSGCLHLSLRRFSPTPVLLRAIVDGGTPSLTRQGLGSVATILLNVAAARYGDAAIAAMSIVGRTSFVINSVVVGFGQGFQPLCGFSYGAGLYDRVRRAYWFCVRFSTVFLVVCSVVGWIFAPDVIGLFRNDAEVVEIGTAALRWQLLSLPLCGFIILSNMMMQTINMPLRANLLAAARRGLFFIPLILLLPLWLGVVGVEACQTVSDVCSFALAVPIIWSVFRTMRNNLVKK